MSNTQKIRELNDQFRTTLIGGRLMLTRSILSRDDADEIVRKVQLFDAFTADNDPHQEHDFGGFETRGETVFFKIDYYSRDLSAGSEDPSDPSLTARVLTVMLAEEY